MRFFDDLHIGYRSTVGQYVLTADEIIAFARTWDPQAFHIDEQAARDSVFGGLVASSLHLFAICTRLFFDHRDEIQILAMLGKDAIRIPNPARPGDTLTYVTECVEHRESTTKPDRGVVVLADTLSNQNGEAVLTQRVTLLLARRRPE